MLLYCAHMESGGSGNSFQNLYVLFVVTFFLKLIALAMQHIEELFKNESESYCFVSDIGYEYQRQKIN